MQQMKRTIAIVCGGDSSEHDVSLRSAQGLYSFFDKERYNVYVVEMKGTDWQVFLHDGTTTRMTVHDFSFKEDGKKRTFDYVYMEILHIPYSTSGVLVEALTFDKFVLNNYLRGFGVKVADSVLVRRGQEKKISKKEIIDIVGMPCFVKPANDGSSFGVSKVVKPDQLAAAIRKASLESDEVMIEQFLEGTEISIGCYKTKNKSVVFPATEVVSENDFFDYDAKYNGQVKEITPARLPEDTAKRVAEITSHIYDILHCNGIIRIDYIISKDQQISMLEINTTPGMTPTSFIPQQVRAAGLSMTDVLTDIVENQF